MSSGPTDGATAKRGVLVRANDALYAVERAIVVTFLMTIAGTMFLDLVYGRLVARDSKIGLIIAKLGGVTDEATRAWIDAEIAPWAAGVLGILTLWGGLASADRERGKPLLPFKGSALVVALVVAAGITLLGWLMLAMQSRHFYVLVWTLGAGAYVVQAWREREEGWQRRIGLALFAATPFFLWFALVWIPLGYTWSQELSLLMMLWIGFLGASVCVHTGQHLRIEAFDRLIPPRFARTVRAIGFACAAAFCFFLALLGYLYVTGPAASTQSAQIRLPDRFSIVSVPIGLALASLRFVVAAASAIRGHDYGRPVSEGETLAAAAAAEKHAAEAEAAS